MKKYAIPISFATIIALLLVGYFASFFSSTNVYNAIPGSAVAVIEINDWTKFRTDLTSFESATLLSKTAAVSKLTDEVALIEQLFLDKPRLKQQINEGKLIISAHLVSADDIDYLYTIPVKDIDSFRLQPTGNIAEVNYRMFKNYQVQDVIMKDGKRFCYTYIKGILVCSFTSFLTESSVTAITSGNNLNHDKELNKVMRKLNFNLSDGWANYNQSFKLFVNFKKADVIFPVSFRQQKLALLHNVTANQSWGAYSISFSNSRLEIAGVSLLPDADKDGTDKNILANTIWNNVPDNAAYVNAGFNTLGGNKDKPADNKMLNSIFKDWVGEAHAFITLEPLKEDFSDQNVFIVQVTDEQKAIASLQHLVSLDGSKTMAVDTFVNAPIFNLKAGAVINQVFGGSFTGFGNSFFCVTNHIAVFCNNADVLKFTLEKISNAETLNKDTTLRNILGNLKRTSSSVLYINPARAQQIFTGMLKDGSTLLPYLSKLNGISITSGISDDYTITYASVVAGSESKAGGELIWKTKLKALSNFAPQIVTSSTGDKEIFTQDTANNVYLISKSGEVIFTRNIGEPILGAVYQLDYYNNGQLQYIFTTPHHVFMLDRFGNDAASYPLRLSNAAIGGLTLVNNGNRCRYYVPCSNGAIYGYEKNGRPLSGFSPKTGLGLIIRPIQVIHDNKNEYILVFNNAGKLILLGGKGEIKWTVDNLPLANQNYSVVQTSGGFEVLSAAGNQLIRVSADGNDNIKPLVDSALSFVATVTSDTTYRYYYSNLHDVRCYGDKGDFVNAVSLKSSVISNIKIVNINNVKYLVVTDEAMKKATVYDLSLQPVAEYPLANTGAFTITGLFGAADLIGIQPDILGNLTCYRIK